MRQADPIGLAKAVLWAEAQGKLRAMVAAAGSAQGSIQDASGHYPYQQLENEIERFIHSVESKGLHE